MGSRDNIHVEQIHITPEQMRAAIKRADENSKHWVVWKDPYTSAQVATNG